METAFLSYTFIKISGIIAYGLVLGWLIAKLEFRITTMLTTILSVFFFILVASIMVLWFLNWINIAYFYCAGLFAFLIHTGWRRKLVNFKVR